VVEGKISNLVENKYVKDIEIILLNRI